MGAKYKTYGGQYPPIRVAASGLLNKRSGIWPTLQKAFLQNEQIGESSRVFFLRTLNDQPPSRLDLEHTCYTVRGTMQRWILLADCRNYLAILCSRQYSK